MSSVVTLSVVLNHSGSGLLLAFKNFLAIPFRLKEDVKLYHHSENFQIALKINLLVSKAFFYQIDPIFYFQFCPELHLPLLQE